MEIVFAKSSNSFCNSLDFFLPELLLRDLLLEDDRDFLDDEERDLLECSEDSAKSLTLRDLRREEPFVDFLVESSNGMAL